MISRNSPYTYIQKKNNYFTPRTPSAALQACEEGFLPIEALIYKSTGLNPIIKKPYNLDEIEWLLSRKKRDLETNLLLKKVLSEISQYKDKEVALFAAESLNAIEKEYNTKLSGLKRKIRDNPAPELTASAAQVYYHLALLNREEKILRNFYLKEAYLLLGDLENRNLAEEKERYLLIRILITLQLYNQAEELLPPGRKSRLISLELAYERRNIPEMNRILSNFKNDRDLTEKEKEILSFWTGENV